MEIGHVALVMSLKLAVHFKVTVAMFVAGELRMIPFHGRFDRSKLNSVKSPWDAAFFNRTGFSGIRFPSAADALDEES